MLSQLLEHSEAQDLFVVERRIGDADEVGDGCVDLAELSWNILGRHEVAEDHLNNIGDSLVHHVLLVQVVELQEASQGYHE